jgi:hypothetical protein
MASQEDMKEMVADLKGIAYAATMLANLVNSPYVAHINWDTVSQEIDGLVERAQNVEKIALRYKE